MDQIVVSTEESSRADAPTMHAWELGSGARVLAFKHAPVASGGLALIRGHYAVASLATKPMLHAYSWTREQVGTKSVLPAMASALAADARGSHLVAGLATGTLMAWDTATGTLLASVEAHYKAVTALVLADDGSVLISAGDDGAIAVWDWPDLLAPRSHDAAPPAPIFLLTLHSLGVADVALGLGGRAARLVSVSADRTLKVWDMLTGKAAASILLPTALNAVALHPCESAVAVGGSNGHVYWLPLAPDAAVLLDLDASAVHTMAGHSAEVTALAFSLDGHTLVSGAADGEILVWDAATRQQIRSYTQHMGPVTNLRVIMRPPHLRDLALSVSALPPAADALAPSDASRLLPLAPFKRTLGAGASAAAASASQSLGATGVMALPVAPSAPSLTPSLFSIPRALTDKAAVITNDQSALIDALQAEIDSLKSSNAQLYERAVNAVLEDQA
ncbi:WD repeat domain 18 [Thecamonas trahens ATCC 50062]|uniref:WD repeat domain 18 n=1 Tax=Thecamonas trahens ATCC 50062 TaxID=461836 RepID=A0A0L0DTM7_THETB|nr:WD repeat domain 18 [Thecamonas trahens ATCC 50062]KNC55595.1 WD repeat domain 18 [Thecamonas trahens ATCC 50062]|eukprot:XP_013761368.1 WD repeat domain 18 [Thecamonas trahens ATCC 50062]